MSKPTGLDVWNWQQRLTVRYTTTPDRPCTVRPTEAWIQEIKREEVKP